MADVEGASGIVHRVDDERSGPDGLRDGRGALCRIDKQAMAKPLPMPTCVHAQHTKQDDGDLRRRVPRKPTPDATSCH